MKKTLLLLCLLLAVPVPASSQIIDTQRVSVVSSGACNAGACAAFQFPANAPSVTLQVSGTFTGTLTFEGTSDGRNWKTVMLVNLADGTSATTTTTTGQFSITNSGLLWVRARATAFASGTATVVATRGGAQARWLAPAFSSITLTTPLATTSGGTGFASYAVGDLLSANTTTTLAKLSDVAVGQLFASGGVGAVPGYTANPVLTGSFTLDPTTGNAFRRQMSTPGTITATPGAAGTLNDGTYAFRLVAVDLDGGVTLPGAEVTCTTVAGAGAGSCALSWAAVVGAASYQIYGSATGAEDRYQVTAALTYVWTTAAGATVAALPTATTAYRFNVGGTSDWFGRPHTILMGGLGTTSTFGFGCTNTTGATATATVQIGPRCGQITGYGWDTDGPGPSRPVSFFTEVLPTSGATVAGTWKLGYIDPVTGVVTYPLTVTGAGAGTLLGNLTALSYNVSITGGITWSSRASLASPADSQFTLANNVFNAGIGLDVAVPDVLKVRTMAQTDYATVDALALRTTGYVSGARTTYSDLKSVTEAVTLTGASIATADIIPAGATVEGIVTTTTTAIEGATGYTIGDGTDADRYGDITGTAVGTASSSANYTADPRWWTTGARAITLTAKTSNFTAGVVQVTVFYRTAIGS